MDDRLDRVGAEDPPQNVEVADISLIKGEGLSGQFLNAAYRAGLSVVKIIERDNLIAGLQHGENGVTADIPGAAGNKYCHLHLSLV